MSFDVKEKKIMMKKLDATNAGTYRVQISLTDSFGDSSHYSLMFIIKSNEIVKPKVI